MLQTARSALQAADPALHAVKDHVDDTSRRVPAELHEARGRLPQVKRNLAALHGKRACEPHEAGVCQLSPHAMRHAVRSMNFHSRASNRISHRRPTDASNGTACLVTPSGCDTYVVESGHRGPTISGVELVITRYSEDLTWLDALPDFSTTVYNKGTSTDLLPTARHNLRILDVENFGREDETMLRHIYENYDHLAPITIFMQGWPYDHCAEVGATLRASVAKAKASQEPTKAVIPLAYTYWQFSPKDGRVGLADQLVNVHGVDEKEMQAHNITEEWLLFDAVCSEVLKAPCPDTLWVAEGAQWLAGRDAIRASPRSLYGSAVQLGEGYQEEYRGIIMESVWPVLFGRPSFDPRESVDGLVQEVSASPLVLDLLRPGNDSSHCWSDLYDSTGDMRLWSCNSAKAFCELSWYSNGKSPSDLYLQSMRPAPINQSAPPERDWSLMVTVQTELPGDAGMVQVVDGSGTAIISTSAIGETQWKVQPAEHQGHVYLRQHGGYLGCGDASSLTHKPSLSAALQAEPFAWRLQFTTRGRVSFESPNGEYLCQTEKTYDGEGTMGLVCSSSRACVPPAYTDGAAQSQAHFMVKA